jgi:type I restriction enzyme S subunit
MAEWIDRPLNDVVALQRGYDLPSDTRNPGPVPVVGSAGISGWHDQGREIGPGVVVGRAGSSMGSATFVREGLYWPLNTSLFVKDFKGNDPRWVYHLFDILNFSGFNSGAAQPMLNRNYISKIIVRVPPIVEQRAIADVLSALDDKISANTKLATTADTLARTKFDAMLTERVSETPLSASARFVNGRNFTKNATGAGRVVIRIAELNSGIGGSTVRNDVEAAEDNIARPGDLLFAWSGSLTVHRWFRDEGVVNQHIFKVVPNDGYPLWLVNQLIVHKLDEFKAIAADKATTMGHIQRRHLDEPVAVPIGDAVAREYSAMQGLWERALLAERERERLAKTRDVLLPALMSGRLTVRAAESAVEGAIDSAAAEPEALASGTLW